MELFVHKSVMLMESQEIIPALFKTHKAHQTRALVKIQTQALDQAQALIVQRHQYKIQIQVQTQAMKVFVTTSVGHNTTTLLTTIIIQMDIAYAQLAAHHTLQELHHNEENIIF